MPAITLLAEQDSPRTRAPDYYRSFKRLFHHALDPIASLNAENYIRNYGARGDLKITWSNKPSNEPAIITSSLPSSHCGIIQFPITEAQEALQKILSLLPENSALATWIKHDVNLFHPRSGDLWSELIPAVLGQRITSKEASAQWRRLHQFCGGYIEPGTLSSISIAEFHRLGIEKSRARTLLSLADAQEAIAKADAQSVEDAYRMLFNIHGIGAWTISEALRRSHGWLDAVSVGDFHLCHHIVFALTGRRRGTDTEMLELLEPYRPYRWIVIDSILHHAASPPRKSPGLPTMDIRRF